MNKPALLAAVTAVWSSGPCWASTRRAGSRPARGAAGGCVHAGARQAGGATGAGRRGQASAFRARHLGRGQPALGRVVVLRPEVAGRIQSIDFKEGQPVARGQALVRLDDSVPRAELAQARANLTLAQTHYRRAVELQGKGFVSQKARDESASSLKVQEAAVALAQARLDKMTITAPFPASPACAAYRWAITSARGRTRRRWKPSTRSRWISACRKCI